MNEGVVKRASAALAVGLVLALTLFLALAPVGAQSQGNPPSVECASDYPAWNGKYFKAQVDEGVLTGQTEGSGSIDLDGTTGLVTWTNTDVDSVFRVVLKVGRAGGSDSVTNGWWQTGEGGTVDISTKGLSHITWCFANPVNRTTTTLAPTTTTVGNTTTTVGNTTTTVGNTTTTVGNTTTTVGNTTTTVGNTTTTVGNTTATLAPTTTTTDTTLSVLGVQITTTSVSPETLPFTGADLSEGGLVGLALALVSLGGIAVLAIRHREAELGVLDPGWSSRLWDVE